METMGYMTLVLLLEFVDFVFEQSFGTTQKGTGNKTYDKIKMSKATF